MEQMAESPVRPHIYTLHIELRGSVVRNMDSAIHWIVIFYPVLKMLLNAIIYTNNECL